MRFWAILAAVSLAAAVPLADRENAVATANHISAKRNADLHKVIHHKSISINVWD